MSAATILFTDVVGFSNKPNAIQKKLVESLTSEVIHEVRHLLSPPLQHPSAIALPTGDGVALAFLHSSPKPWDGSNLFKLILRLHQWAYDASTASNAVELRVGVHVGAVELVTDVNGRPNICGDTINYTQRVMDAASPRQTLFSDTAFRTYIGSESTTITDPPFSSKVKASFSEGIEVHAKHGLQIQVHKMILTPEKPFVSNADPIAKSYMLVRLTELPKEIVGSFSAQLNTAEDVALIMLTGERLLKKLEAGDVAFSNSIKRLWVFMPDPETYAGLKLSSNYANPNLVKNSVEGWKSFLKNLQADRSDSDIKLGLFQEPPYFGGSFLNWDRPQGRIHVSPYIWNVKAENCPGYDIQWVGKNPSDIYESYINGLRYINQITKNEL